MFYKHLLVNFEISLQRLTSLDDSRTAAAQPLASHPAISHWRVKTSGRRWKFNSELNLASDLAVSKEECSTGGLPLSDPAIFDKFLEKLATGSPAGRKRLVVMHTFW